MKQKKNIDDLFRENLSGLSAQPSGKVWENLEAAYVAGASSSRRRIIYAAAALLLLLLGFGGWYFYSHNEVLNDQSPEEMTITASPGDVPAEGRTAVDEVKVRDNEETAAGGSSAGIEDGNVKEKDMTSLPVATQQEENVVETVPGDVTPDENYADEQAGEPGIVHSIYTDIVFMKPVTLTFDQNPEPSIIDPEKVTGMKEYLEKKKKSHFYTGLSGMAGMMYYPSTKDQFTWSADLAFGLTAGHFYFETGIGYQSMKEEGIYNIEFRSYDSIGYYNQVQSFEVNPQNPDEIIYKTKEVPVYDSISHYTHAAPALTYNYVNIPLTVGYRFFDKKKISLGIETGLLVSYLVGSDIPEVEFNYPEYTHIKTINETPERVDLNFRWQIALRLNYRLAGALSVSLKPVFNTYINSVYDTGKGYPDVKPYSMGMQVGLYYGF